MSQEQQEKDDKIFRELYEKCESLYNQGLYRESIKVMKTAPMLIGELTNQQLISYYIKLGNSYYRLDDKVHYTHYYEEYLKLCPDGQASVFSRLANAYYHIDIDRSIENRNKALEFRIKINDITNKLFGMTKSFLYSQQEYKEEAELEASRVKTECFNNIQPYTYNSENKKKDKKLNIGYLSFDCYAHTMMNYMLPVWKNHNTDEFNFFIFNGSTKKDLTYEKIINLSGFNNISIEGFNIYDLAKSIRENDIDILIDLGGYTHSASYVSFFKPAPIFIQYLGYLNTLGLTQFDYILADKYSIPEDKAYLYTEKPLYLDTGYQVFMNTKFPEISECPYKRNGYITFGSFNCPSKLNDAVFYMWAKILEAVPNSKLLIYRMQLTKNTIKHIKTKLIDLGVPKNRIMFSLQKLNPHFSVYSKADISLDPFPFSGMSIAIENAYMGTPTITMLGEGLQSRGAGRINHVLGLDELNAQCGEEYIKNAVELANDREKLDELRKSLRDKIKNSSISNYESFTRELESKYKEIWEKFVNSLE